MNYNALLLLDKHHNHKVSFPMSSSNMHQFPFFRHKTNDNINIHNKYNQKYKKCYSVKPYLYMMPKDIIISDIFNNEIKSSNEFIKKYDIINEHNIFNNNNEDRKYIFNKIKKFVIINHINYNIFGKTIFLYDLLCFQKQKQNKNIKNYNNFYCLPNLLIALIAFILVLKFNKEDNKIISLKHFMKKFEEKDENITFNNVYEMEIVALQLIDYNLSFQTPFSFMELFLINGIIFNEDCINGDMSFSIYESVNETLENIMVNSNEYFKYNYFYLCCSIITYVREKYNINRWPKALEINFDVNYEQFSYIYNIFCLKRNNNNNNNNNYYSNNKNNIKKFYNSDIINISNLKGMNNIINVLKIMKSADKYKKNKDTVNKLDLFTSKTDIDEKCKDKDKEKEKDKDNINTNLNINTLSKVKVELSKNYNFDIFKSPGKLTMTKTSISNILIKLSEGNENIISNNYNKNSDININKEEYEKEKENDSEKNIEENINNNEEKQVKNEENSSNSEEPPKNENLNKNIKNNNININKNYNRFKKTININKICKNSQENNDMYNNNIFKTDGYYSNNISNQNGYKNRIKKGNNSLNSYPDKNKEIKNHLNNRNKNSYNISIRNHIPTNKANNRYYNNYTEKKKYNELNNDSNCNKKNNFNVNQTSFNDFLFQKNKNNKNKDIDNENYLDNYKSKNKDENSNAPTCESSNLKLSSNDFSIRKSYRLKKKYTQNEIAVEKKLSPKNDKNKQYEKERKKILEKNKSYNKLLNAKISFSDKTYNRKTGLRKFYKQKNLIENH